MMKKRLTILGICFSLALSMSSCEKWLDVQPRTKIKSDNLLQTASGYRDALIGSYTLLNSPQLYGRELSFGFIDVLAQQYDVFNNTTYNEVAKWNYESAAVRSQIDNIWGKMYNTIANLNNILDHIDSGKQLLTEEEYALIKGEALAMRAYLHFDLLRIFGSSDLSQQAIPYLDKLSTKITAPLQGTAVLARIIEDAKAAEVLLSKDPILEGNKYNHSEDLFFNNRHQRFNYYVTKALLARAYMWGNDKDKALVELEAVLPKMEALFPWIKSSDISASEDKNKDFTFSTENLMALQVVNLKDIANTWFISALPTNQLQRGTYYYEQMFEKANIGANDFRLLFTSRLINFNYIQYKYYQPDGYKLAYAQMIPLLRRSELNYMAAECLVDKDNARAIQLLDEVRSHRGIGTALSKTLNSSQITAEILKEYRKEFQAEGQLFYYCKRTKQAKFPTSGTTLTDKQYVLPKPVNELEFGDYSY